MRRSNINSEETFGQVRGGCDDSTQGYPGINPSRRKMLAKLSLALSAAVGLRRAHADEGEPEILRCRPLPPVTPDDVGPDKKFSVNGKAQRYPGNTVICHLPKQSEAFAELGRACAALRAEVGTRNLSWLPPDSYHMTVFDGATNAYRRPGDWPQMLPLDASMDACNRYLAERLRKFDLGLDPPIRMVVDEREFPGGYTLIPLRPVDARENRRLRDLRDRISVATGVRHPNHDSYRFHTSFAYYVRQFTADEEVSYQLALARTVQRLRKALPVIELAAPEYCLFDDMLAFPTQFLLRKL